MFLSRTYTLNLLLPRIPIDISQSDDAPKICIMVHCSRNVRNVLQVHIEVECCVIEVICCALSQAELAYILA